MAFAVAELFPKIMYRKIIMFPIVFLIEGLHHSGQF